MNFVIRSEGGVSFTFHARAVGKDGWVNAYFVTAEAANFTASVEVDNAPYGSSPADFFAEIASEWAGWNGTKGWQALEGEYQLSATSDSTGHITIVARLNPASFPPTWEGRLSLIVEAGRLEALAVEAKEFFAPVKASIDA
jgi:hypothetical protein